MKRQGVSFHTIHNPDMMGAIVERFNRTLKTKIYKYFTNSNTYRYLDVINKLLTSNNCAFRSSYTSKQNQPFQHLLDVAKSAWGENFSRSC